MRKIILLVSIIAIFTSCTHIPQTIPKSGENQHKESSDSFTKKENTNKTIEVMKNGKNILSDIGKDVFDIIYFEEDSVFYSVMNGNNNKDAGNLSIYYYSIKSGESKKVADISGFLQSSSDAAERNGKIYYPFTKTEMEKDNGYRAQMLEIDMKSLKHRFISCKNEVIPMFFIESTLNGIIKISQRSKDGATYSAVDLIRVDDGDKVKTIIENSYNNKEGEIITCISATEKSLYCYVISGLELKESYIMEYTFDGKLINKYKLDLESFMDLSDKGAAKGEVDGVISMCKAKDYFILSTINSRILIFREEGKKLKRIEVPNKIESFSAGASFVSQYKQNSKYIFFQEILDPEKIFVFDIQNGLFSNITLDSEERISSVKCDSKGNLIITLLSNASDEKDIFQYIPYTETVALQTIK